MRVLFCARTGPCGKTRASDGISDMSQTGPTGSRAAPPPPVQVEREERRALQSWWRGFKKSDKKVPEQQGTLRVVLRCNGVGTG